MNKLKRVFNQKRRDTILRMAGNIASGLASRYSVNDLDQDRKRQNQIASVAARMATRIEEEVEG